MSLCSGRTLTPSILKKPTIHERLKLTNSATKVRFTLPHSQNVRKIFQDFLKRDNTKDYQQLICLIRDSELTDEDLSSLLKESNECISMINNDLRLFTEVLLTVQWVNRDTKLVKEFQSFLNNLLVAHTCHSKVVIDSLVSLFLPQPQEGVWESGKPSVEEAKKYSNIHKVLKTLFKIVPMCKDLILDSLNRYYPYMIRGIHINDCYLYNLLEMLNYAPSLKSEILNLIFIKLINMDVAVPRDIVEKVYSEVSDEIFSLDDHQGCSNTSQVTSEKVLVDTLDICLKRIFKFVHAECHNESGDLDWDKTKDFYKTSLKIFDGIILPTYNSHHVQFCWFILFSFKPCLAETFIEHLWKKAIDPSLPPVIRQTSVYYIASLAARASYINLRLLKNIIQQFSSWIHSYINAQDDVECVNSNLKVHTVFYSTCQALFYITFFRHKEMVSSNKNLSFLQNLNFSKIVTCPLNPLRVCQPAVVQNFAAFTRNYQLAYCHSIIEHNSRTNISTIYQNQGRLGMAQTNDILEAKFPFDPYVLQQSKESIAPFYKVYEEIDSVQKDVSEDVENDDFIDQSYVSNKRMKFSYGSSPGFKFNI